MDTPLIFIHDRGCPRMGKGHTDAAKRVYDTYHLHKAVGLDNSLGKFFAATLADGTTDGMLYDNRESAVLHQHHNENYYTFIQITMANMTVCAAEVMLGVYRRLYDAGRRESDSGGRDIIKRSSTEDQLAYLRGITTNVDWN
jgi:hypothetical protein